MMMINHSGNGNSPTLVIGKTSAVHISIYSLIAFLAQTIIITGSVVMIYSNLTSRQTTFESDLNWIRSNQTAYTNHVEKLTAGLKEIDLIKRDLEVIRQKSLDHERWISEVSSKVEYWSSQTIENNVLIRNLHPESKISPSIPPLQPHR